MQRAPVMSALSARAQSPGPRLPGRFALYAAIALPAAMAGTFRFVREEAIQRAEQTGRFHTRFVADAILRDRLAPSDFAHVAAGARLAQLDTLAHRKLMSGG